MRRTMWLAVAILVGLGSVAVLSDISDRSAHAADEPKPGFVYAKGEPFFINRSSITYVKALVQRPDDPPRVGEPPFIEVYFIGNKDPLLLHGASAKAVLKAVE